MAQYLKPDVEQRIRRAALEVFAERGFRAASVAEIARSAGISAGNVYRYFETKELLFEAVVPPSLARELLALLRARVRALAGTRDVFSLAPTAPYHVAGRALLAFVAHHRLEVVVLLGRGEGSLHEGFAKRVRALLEELTLAHFHALDPARAVDGATRFALGLAYESFVHATVQILALHESEAEIEALANAYARFHLAGLSQLFA